ncbi:MAG: ROK family protein [Bacteroidales bacterium]|nr:ROK family protein [Bacteroidales bacterium]
MIMANTYSIGIDIGGTNTDIGLVRDDGFCMARKNLPTNQYFDAELYVSDICAQIRLLMSENQIDAIEGIGIAAPAGNFYTGCIENAANLNFKGVVDLSRLFRKHIDVPVVVSNDANAAAYGELVYGGAKGMQHFVMFTLGTGIGSGVVVDGKLVHGKTGGAGELGHAILIPEGRQCGCGRKGCLETYCSATGIRRTALEMLEENPGYDGILSKVAKDELTSKTVGDAAKAGDPLALKVFEKTGYLLGIALANAVTFSGPEAIFLMGGPVKAGEVLMGPVRKSFEENLLYTFANSVDVRVSELNGNDVAILGAAALVKAKV